MRLWSIHPDYLDQKGLVALWREGLLAQKVLAGETRGYKKHPQLIRFKNTDNPVAAIGYYLIVVHEESLRRNFRFNKSKILRTESPVKKINIKQGQLEFEYNHLMKKLIGRDREQYDRISGFKQIRPHPIFRIVMGGVEDWEVSA